MNFTFKHCICDWRAYFCMFLFNNLSKQVQCMHIIFPFLAYLFPNAAAWPIFILYVESYHSTYHSMPDPPLPALHYQTTHPDPAAIASCLIHLCRHMRRACLSTVDKKCCLSFHFTCGTWFQLILEGTYYFYSLQ